MKIKFGAACSIADLGNMFTLSHHIISWKLHSHQMKQKLVGNSRNKAFCKWGGCKSNNRMYFVCECHQASSFDWM